MELFGSFLNFALDLFKMPITLFGFTFSLWSVFVVSVIIGLAAKFIWGLFD